ncbi:MAG: hypothetical protein HQL72_15455, partial [Magnetococcales bacterium]|nr:hypothetical protein [Magnetococcales bacterium]
MIEEILLLLNRPWASWLFGEIILVWGFASWLILRWQHVRPIQRWLDEGLQPLQSCADAQEFAQAFEQIDQQLTDNPLLGQTWLDFRRHLTLSSQKNRMVSLQDPRHFFQAEPLLQTSLDTHYYRSMPAYLVGSGLLASTTFLIAGLFFVSQAFSLSDINHSQQVLSLFFGGASFKFFPALVGIFSGLLFSWGQRRQFNEQGERIAEFRRLLYQHIDLSDLEDLKPTGGGSEIDTTRLSQSMDRAIQQLDSSLIDLKQKTVTEVMAAVAPLSDEIRQERKRLVALHEESLETLLESVTSKVKTQVEKGHEQLQQASKRLDRNTQGLDERFSDLIQQALIPVIGSIREEISQLAQTQEKSLRRSLEQLPTESLDSDAASRLVGSLRGEMAQWMTEQKKVIHSGLDGVAQQLRDLFPAEGINQLIDSADPTDKETMNQVLERLKGRAFIEPVIELIRTEGKRFSQQNDTVAEQILKETIARLHQQIDLETQRLRQTSEQIDRSTARLVEQADQFAEHSLDRMEGALRHEGDRLIEKNQQSLRQTLSDITTQLRAQVGETTQELVVVSERLSHSATLFETQKPHQDDRSEARVLEAVQAEGAQIRALLAEQPIMAQISQALQAQSEQLAQSHSQSLQRLLGDVAVQSVDGELILDPILSAVAISGERVLERQSSLIREVMEGAMGRLQESLAIDQPLAAIQSLSDQLTRKQTALSREITSLKESLSPDGIIEAMWAQTDGLAKKQESLSNRVIHSLTEALAPTSVLEAIEGEAKQAAKGRNLLHKLVEELGENLSPQRLLEAIQGQTSALAEQQSAISEEIAQLRESFSAEKLQKTLTNQQIALDEVLSNHAQKPLLDALKKQGEQLAKRQSETLQQVLGDVAVRGAQGEEKVVLDPLLAAVHAANERSLAQQGETIQKVVAEAVESLNQSLSPQPIIEALESRAQLLNQQQLTLSQEMAELGEALARPDLIEAIVAQGDRLANKQSAISREIAALGETLAPDRIISLLNEQNRRLAQGQEKLTTLVTDLGDNLSPQRWIEAVKQQTNRLFKQQERLSQEMSELGQSLALQPLIEAIQQESRRWASHAMEPLLTALKEQSKQLADNQSQTLQQLLGDGVVRYEESQTENDEKRFSIDPIRAAITASGERIMARQESQIETALAQAVETLNQSLAPEKILAPLKSQTDKLFSQQAELNRQIIQLEENLSFDEVIEAVRHESQRTLQSQKTLNGLVTGLSETLSPEQLLDSMNSQTERMLDKQNALSRAIDQLESALAPDRVLAALKQLSDQRLGQPKEISLEPVLAAIKSQGQQLAESQSQTLQQTLNAIAVRSDGGEVTLDPLLVALQSSDEKMLANQERIINKILSGTITQLQADLSPERLVGAIQTEIDNLTEQQQNLKEEMTLLGEQLSPAGLIELVKSESQRLSQGQESLNGLVAGLGDALSPDIVIDALRSESKRLMKGQKNLRQEMARWGESLSAEMMAMVVGHTPHPTESPLDNSRFIQPILTALQEQTRQLAQNQSQALQAVLKDVAVASGDGEVVLDPLLALVRSEGENQRQQQSHIIREALDGVVSGLQNSFSPQTIIDAMKGETERILTQQRQLKQDMATLGEEVSDALEAEAAAPLAVLAPPLPTPTPTPTPTPPLSFQPIFEAIRQQTDTLTQQLAQLSQEPILTALAQQSRTLAQSQSQAIQEALSGIAVQDTQGTLTIDPLLAAIKAESERQIQQQATLVQEALDTVTAQLDKSLTSQEIIEAIQEESHKRAQQQAQINQTLEEMAPPLSVEEIRDTIRSETTLLAQNQTDRILQAIDTLSLTPILDQIKAHNTLLADDQQAKLQEALDRVVAELIQSVLVPVQEQDSNSETAAEAGLTETQQQMIQQALSGLSVVPVLEALNQQNEQLIRSQRQALQEALSDLSVRDGQGGMALEPLLASVKLENERQLERQESVIRETLSGLVTGLAELKEDTGRLAQQLTAGEGPNSVNQASIIAAVQAESQRIISWVDEAISEQFATLSLGGNQAGFGLEQVVAAVRDQLGRFSESQENVVRETLTNLSLETAELISIEPLIDVVQRETATLSDTLLQTVQDLMAHRGDADSHLSLTPVLDAIQRQGEQLATSQSQTLQAMLEEINRHQQQQRDPDDTLAATLDTLVGTVKEESQQIIKHQGEVVREAMAHVMSDIGTLFSPNAIIDAIKQETRRLTEQLDEGQQSDALTLETILDTMRDQGMQMMANQTRVLQEVLSNLGGEPRQESGLNDLELIVSSVRVEGEKLLQQQRESVRESMEMVTTELLTTLAPDSLIETVKTEMSRLMESLQQENRRLEGGVDLTPLLEAMQRETLLLSESLGTVFQSAIGDVTRQSADGEISLQPVLEAIQESSNRIVEKMEAAPIPQQMLASLRQENDHLLERLKHQITMAPVIEALQTQGEIIASQQQENLRTALAEIVAGGSDGLALNRVIDSVRTESDRVVEQITQQFSLAPLVQSLEGHIGQIAATQFKTLHDTLTEVASSYADGRMDFEPILAAIRTENSQLTDTLSRQLNHSTLLTTIREEMAQLADNQNQILQQSLAQIDLQPGESFSPEPLFALMQNETQRMTEAISRSLDLSPIIETIQRESQTLAQSQAGTLEKIIAQFAQEGGVEVDLQQLAATLQAETRQMIEKLGARLSPEPIVQTVRAENSRLIQEQSQALERAVEQINQQISRHGEWDLQPIIRAIQTESQRLATRSGEAVHLEPILERIQAENSRLIQEQSQILREEMARADQESPAPQTLDVEPILTTIQAETQQLMRQLEERTNLNPVLDAVQQQGEALAHRLDSKIALNQKVIDAIKGQGDRLAKQLADDHGPGKTAEAVASRMQEEIRAQTQALQTVIATAVERLRGDLTPEKLLEVIKSESGRIASTLENINLT